MLQSEQPPQTVFGTAPVEFISPTPIDLSTFTENAEMGNEYQWVVQCKGFNRDQRLERKNIQNATGISGSTTQRPVAEGAVMVFDGFPQGEPLAEERARFSHRIKDSRGMALDPQTQKVFIGSVNEILELDVNSGSLTPSNIHNDWLAFVHSINFSPDGKKMLVSSSGFDRIMEFNKNTGNKTREWVAWNNGFNHAVASKELILDHPPTTTPAEPYKVITSPKEFGNLGLPPAERCAFPNSATYFGNEDTVLATLFHHGLVKIDMNTGKTDNIFNDLLHPHSVLPYKDGFIVTDTGHGRVLIFNSHFQVEQIIDFTSLPGADPKAGGKEWLQHVRPINKFQLAAVDSNRTGIYVIDLEKREKRTVPLPHNWVLQEIMPITK